MEEEKTGIQLQTLEGTLAQEILQTGLENFDFDKMLETCHPKELIGVAGDVYAFLYEVPTIREVSLLQERSRLEQQQTNTARKSN